MRIFIFAFMIVFGPSAYAQKTAETLDCHRRMDAKTELTSKEYTRILPFAQRLHHQLTGSWGRFVEISQALYFRGELHVVARFAGTPKPFEIVAIYNLQEERVRTLIAPNIGRDGVTEYQVP